MYKDKLIRGIDQDIWKQFVKYCKKHKESAGSGLSKVMARFLNSRGYNISTSIEYTWEQFDNDVERIIDSIKDRQWHITAIYAIPRGGLTLGTKLSHYLGVPLLTKLPKKDDFNILIVDDISDKGNTLMSIPNINQYNTVTLAIKNKTGYIPKIYCRSYDPCQWTVFPWESGNSPKQKDYTFDKK